MPFKPRNPSDTHDAPSVGTVEHMSPQSEQDSKARIEPWSDSRLRGAGMTNEQAMVNLVRYREQGHTCRTVTWLDIGPGDTAFRFTVEWADASEDDEAGRGEGGHGLWTARPSDLPSARGTYVTQSEQVEEGKGGGG